MAKSTTLTRSIGTHTKKRFYTLQEQNLRKIYLGRCVRDCIPLSKVKKSSKKWKIAVADGFVWFLDTIGFATEKELLQYVQENGTEDFSMLAVVFHEDVQKIPEKLSYDIRVYNTIKNWQVKQLYVDNYEYSEDQGNFILIEHLIFSTLTIRNRFIIHYCR